MNKGTKKRSRDSVKSQTLNQFVDKKRNIYSNEYDSEDEGGGMGPGFPDISGLMKAEKKKVFRDHNHIYFRCEVTMDRVNKLCNLIEEYNREQELLRSELTSSILVPKPIYLHITSMGGDMLGGFLAFDYIKNSKIPVYTIAEGYAVSSGANMFMAGHKRFMTENSYLLVHQLSMTKCVRETFHDMVDEATNVIEFMTKMYGIYLNNIRHSRHPVPPQDILTKEKLENHMLHDIYWNFETCKRYGLVDALYTNYTDTDTRDIEQYIDNRIKSNPTGQTQTQAHSLNDLKPSDEVVERIKQTLEEMKGNDMVEMIKKHLAKNLTTSIKSGLINGNGSVDLSQDLSQDPDLEPVSEPVSMTRRTKRRKKIQTKKSKGSKK